MKSKLITVVQYLFFLGLGLLFVWLTVKNIKAEQWQQIKASIANARHWLVLPVTGMLVLSHYFRALRWKLLMQPIGYNPGTFNTWAAVMIGYLVNAGVPRLGEIVKCTLLARYENVAADKLVGTIVLERIIDVVCLFVVFVLALVWQGHVIGDFTANLFGGALSGFNPATPKAVIIILAVMLALFVFFRLLNRFSHINIVGKVQVILSNVGKGLSSIRHMEQRWLFTFYTILIWALYLGSTTAGIYALRETAHLGLGAGITTLAVGSVGMIITPGGIGAYPLLVARLMQEYGLDFNTTGTALGWLLWSAQTIIIIIGGVVFFGLLQYFNKSKSTHAQPAVSK